MKFFRLTFVLLVLSVVSTAQEDKKFDLKFSGFVRTDFFYDTRQTVAAREGLFLLYPTNVVEDNTGKDINEHPSMNILSIHSRLRGKFSGLDAFGAKMTGMLEGSFFGHTAADVNGFRLRHAFVKLKWDKAELLAGQYWHPLFVTSCFPGVASYNTGVLFQPFSRNPQVRFTYNLNENLSAFAALNSQRDFASPGGSTPLMRSALPEANVQISFKSVNESGQGLYAGIGGSYKMLTPRLVTDSNYYAGDEKVKSMAGLVYVKAVTKPVTIKAEAVLGQNMFDMLMLGGYAQTYNSAIDTNMSNFDYKEYTTLDVMSLWLDVHTNGTKIQAGLFGGFTKNMGTLANVSSWDDGFAAFSGTARGANIDYVYRISPRVMFIQNRFSVRTEVEYSVAAYGTTTNSLAEVQNAADVSNIRVLLSLNYNF